MYSLHLDMWESSQGTKPTARMKKALVLLFFFFFFSFETSSYIGFILFLFPSQIFYKLDFHLCLLFIVIFLVIPLKMLAGVDY